MIKILILCTGNSIRSQIAEGYFRKYLGDSAEIYSAGIEVHGVNPYAIKVMKEDGTDISYHTSNNVREYSDINFEYVITVCDNALERCPYFPGGTKKFHHDFPDPAKEKGSEEEILSMFRKVRDMIKDYVRKFIKEELS
jgi:arsenate reductase